MPVCVKSVLPDGVCVCVLCAVLPCCEGEVGTAGWLKLLSSAWESSGGDWGGSCPGVNWEERDKRRHDLFCWAELFESEGLIAAS